MAHPYRGNDDRLLSGEGSIDEAAEREAQEHAARQPDDDKATPDDENPQKINGREVLDGSRTVDEDEARDDGQGPVEEPPS